MSRVLIDPQPVRRLPHLQLFFDAHTKAFHLFDARAQRDLGLQAVHELLDAKNLRECCTSIVVLPAEHRDPLLASLVDAHPDPADGIVQFVARVHELLQSSH